MANLINYLSLTGLQKYDASIKSFIEAKVSEGDAKSFKYVDLVNGVLKFYTINPLTEGAVAAFEIELPEQDLSHLMALVEGAVKNNVAVFGDNGQVVDGGVAIGDIATKVEVEAVAGDVEVLEGKVQALEEGTYDDNDPIGVLDVTISSNLILDEILGIKDLRSDKRIDFVGGIRGLGELKKRVDNGEMEVALALYPVSMKQLMDIADTGNIMPPKTTWFEPKLRSGLVIHKLV